MPELIDSTSGAPVSVSDAETPFVIGNSKLALPSVVVVVSPSGSRYDAPGDPQKIKGLLSRGWRIEAPEETRHLDIVRKYGGSPIRAGLEGAASAATLGLSDVLQTKTGFASPEELSGRREANPEAYTLGQVGGIAASLLIPGAAPGAILRGAEATAAGKVLGATARAVTAPSRLATAASTAAGKAAVELLAPAASAGSGTMARMLAAGAKLGTEGVVDGALFGTGQLVSEHALGDTDLNTERVLSHIGTSALLGGALGAGLGGLVGAASPAASAARAKILENIEKIPGINRQSIAEELKVQSHKAALSSVSALGGLIKKLKKQGLSELGPEALFELTAPDGKPIIQGFRDAHQLAQRLDDTAELLGGRIRAPINSLDAAGVDAGINPSQIADRLEKNLLEPYKKEIGTEEAANLLKREIGKLRDMGEVGPAGLRVDKELGLVQTPGATGYQNVSHGWLQDMRQRMGSGYEHDRIADEARRGIERELNGILEESLKDKLSPEAFKDYMDAKKGFRSIAAIQQATGNRVATLEGNRYFSLSDRITSGATQAMYGGLQGGLEGAANAALPLAEGSLIGLGAAVAARQIRTRGASALAIFLNKASKMMALEGAVAKAATSETRVLDQAVASLFGGRQGARTASILNRPLVKKQSEEILRIMSDPNAVQRIRSEIQDGLGDVAPQIADGLASKMMANISFLASKVPREELSPLGGLTPKVASHWEPSDAQVRSYSRYAEAVGNPLKVVEDLSHGTFNHEGMEVLDKLYPTLKNELKIKFVERVATSKKPIPYNKRIAVALLLGIPNADPTLVPKYIASMQAGFAKQPQQSEQQKPITVNASKSLGKLQQQNMTQTDRIASGGE